MNTPTHRVSNADLTQLQKGLGVGPDFTNCSVMYELSNNGIVSEFIVNLPNILMRIGRNNFIIFEQNKLFQKSTINEDALKRLLEQMPRLLLKNVPNLVYQRFVFLMLGLVGSKCKERNHLMESVNELSQDSKAFREGRLEVLNQDLLEMMRWQWPMADQLMRAIERFEQYEKIIYESIEQLTRQVPCSESDFEKHLQQIKAIHKEFNWLK